MPRSKNTIPTVEWKLHIEGLVAAQIELLLTDPMRKKPRLGARGKLTTELYKRWIQEKVAEFKAAGKSLPENFDAPGAPSQSLVVSEGQEEPQR